MWIIVRGDYLCDLGAAISKAADSLWFGSQGLSRFWETSGVLFRKLCRYLIRQIVQDADAVLCGLQSRNIDKYQIKYSLASSLITYIYTTY